MSFITIDPTVSIPVTIVNDDGVVKNKSLPYAITCEIGNGSNILTFILREFNKNGKQGKSFLEITLDGKYNVQIKTFEIPNTKGYFYGFSGIESANLTEYVISHYFVNYDTFKNDSSMGVKFNESYKLFNALIPLFTVELSDLSKNGLKNGVKRQIKSLTESVVYDAFLTVQSDDDMIDHIQSYIKAERAKTQAKPAK